MDADLDDLGRVNHLVRRLQGGSRRKELRDATYTLFGRPELVKERKKLPAVYVITHTCVCIVVCLTMSSRGSRSSRGGGGGGGRPNHRSAVVTETSPGSSSSESSSASSSGSSDSDDSSADESSDDDDRSGPQPKLTARRELAEPDVGLNGDDFSGG